MNLLLNPDENELGKLLTHCSGHRPLVCRRREACSQSVHCSTLTEHLKGLLVEEENKINSVKMTKHTTEEPLYSSSLVQCYP